MCSLSMYGRLALDWANITFDGLMAEARRSYRAEPCLCYDQLNGGEFTMFEVLCRRFQMWGDYYAQHLRTRDCRCRVGMFAVKKKTDEQRLVLDTRSSSCYFDDPPKVLLAPGQAFVSIEVEPGQQVWLGNVDIQVAFLGVAQSRYRGLVCPTLTDYVAAARRDKASILKERRKAR